MRIVELDASDVEAHVAELGQLLLDAHAAGMALGLAPSLTRAGAEEAWREIARALATSGEKADRDLAHAVAKYVGEMPAVTGADRTGVSHLLPEPSKHVDHDYQK